MLEDKELKDSSQVLNRYDFSSSPEEDPDLAGCGDETRSRLRAVQLYQNGHSIEDVVSETGHSRSSLLNWCKAYRQHGLQALFDRRQGGNNAKLTEDQIRDLCERIRGNTPRDLLGKRTATQDGQSWTVEDLYAVISQWYGVSYKSRTSYYNLLKRCVAADRRSE